MGYSLNSLKGNYILMIISFIVIFIYCNYSKWRMNDTTYDYITPSITAVFTGLAIYLNMSVYIPVNDEILMGGYPSTE